MLSAKLDSAVFEWKRKRNFAIVVANYDCDYHMASLRQHHPLVHISDAILLRTS